jgi:hypothetical protein
MVLAASCLLPACVGDIDDAGDELVTSDARNNGGYNCKRDKVVDSAAQISATADSSFRAHVTAAGGSDASGAVKVASYVFTDDAGQAITVFPSGFGCVYGDDSANMFIELLSPGTHYRVTAVSADACGNTAPSNAVDITTPAEGSDTAGPTLAGPSLIYAASFGGPVPSVLVMAKDDQAMDRVIIRIDGVEQSIWGQDGQWSRADGEAYWGYVGFLGRQALVEVDAYDLAGNLTHASALIDFPAR